MNASQKQYILYFPTWYPVKNQPRSGNAVQRLASAVNLEIPVVVLYVGGTSAIGSGYKIDYCLENGVETYRFLYARANLNEKATLIQKVGFLFLFVYLSFKGFNLIKNKFGLPKLIHVHVLTRNAIIAYALKCRYRIPYYITEHWSRYFPEDGAFSNPFHKFLTRYLVKKSSGISAVSFALKTALEDHGIEHQNFCVLPNIVNTHLFKPGKGLVSTQTKFIHVSCFKDADKNISGIIRAANNLDTLGFSFEVDLVGNGIDYAKLKQMHNGLFWRNVKINFLGEKQQVELPNLYTSATAMIVNSNYETFCSVVAEAHCCGLPVIATNIAALPELVKEENGILIEVNNDKELGAAMIKFCKKELVYNSLEIASRAEKMFNDTAVCSQVLSFYNS